MQDKFQILKRLLAVNKKYFFCCLILLFSFAICAQTQTVPLTTSSTSPWTVPAGVTKITVEAWGGGGGSGGIGWNEATSGNGGNGGNGGNTTILGINAEGGYGSLGSYSGGTATPGASGGEALYGDINTNGSNGGTYSIIATGISVGGDGGASPNGGATMPGPTIEGNNKYINGLNGNSPGGGAAGAAYTRNQLDNIISIGGGGGGAYSRKTEDVSPNQTIPYTVGLGGALGEGTRVNGGSGAPGQIHILYSTFSLTSTSVTASPICNGDQAIISIVSNATGLPNGSYTLTYTLTGNEAETYTTDITVSSNTAIFNTIALTGSTTVTVTNIENDDYGSNITANNTASVTVEGPVGGSITGNTQICIGTSTGNLTLTGFSGTISTWERRIDGGGWNNLGTSNSTISESPWSAGIWEYRVLVQDGSCPDVYSEIHTITVDPAPSPGWLSKDHYNGICLGETTPTITLNDYTGDIARWERRLNSGTWDAVTHTTNTYSETPTSPGTWDYRAVVKSGICDEAFSSNISVIVNENPTINPLPNDELCAGETMQLTASEGGSWASNNTSVATIVDYNGTVTAVASGTTTFTFTAYNTGCSTTSDPLTVLASPSAVSVSGGGDFCGSTTLTATGGTGGTIYFQGTTSGDTSTANPSTSETITTSGTYYFRSQAANGCWGPEGSATVTITEIPEISVDNNPSVCQNTTSADLYFTPTDGNPQGFNIYFDSDALSQGFSNQNGSVPGTGNPIVVQVPWSAPVGTYNATITVNTWSPVCTSPSYPFTITVNETVGNPGAISGSTSLCPGVSTATYSIAPVPGATNYIWTVPVGWSITAGQGTTEITVSTGSSGGDISVVAENDCGTSDNPSTLSVSTEDNEAPVVTCPASQTFDANYTGCTYQVPNDNSLNASATDNCVVASITHDYNGGGNSLNEETFPVGTTTVTWTASDGGGLESTCDFDINVVNPVSATISTLYVEDCPDLELDQGFNPQSGSYDAGSTDITFIVTLSGTSATYWSFNYEIKNATVRTDLTEPPFTPFYNQSGNIIDTTDNPVSLTFYINNNPPVELHPTLEITNIIDGNGCNAADADPLSVTIKAMPDVGDYE